MSDHRDVMGPAVGESVPEGLGVPVPVSARDAVNRMTEAGLFDELFAQIDTGDLQLTGPDGFLPALTKAVLERGLAAELAQHLGYAKGDPAGRGTANSRNGSTPKTVRTEVGNVELHTPRDRLGDFEPRLVPKGARQVDDGLSQMIISLYAGGMTVRDIEHHLARTLGVELSRETISKITDAGDHRVDVSGLSFRDRRRTARAGARPTVRGALVVSPATGKGRRARAVARRATNCFLTRYVP